MLRRSYFCRFGPRLLRACTHPPRPSAAAALAARTAMQSITSKCFNGCVSDPDQDLSRRQKTCIAECQDNYVKVMQLVAQSMKETGDRMG